MGVEKWLESLKQYWANKDLTNVIALFSDDVEYFETPYTRLGSKEEILKEWQGVLSQENITLDFSIFTEFEGKSAVIWELSYAKDEITHSYKGTYLIGLDNEGLCKYFYQTCEERN